jgi:hypothetical protein
MSFCGLCKKEKLLKNSHLMPKSLYRSIRKSSSNGDQDIILCREYNNTSAYTDYQVKKYFLCEDCEEKLNKFGENIVCPECYHGPEKFILLDKIKEVEGDKDEQGEKWINPVISGNLNWAAYLYFSVSILWRASAGDWSDGLASYKNSLGKRYQEDMRLYLLGESEFPENIYVGVYADNDIDICHLMLFPQIVKKVGYHHHVFYIPGVKFSLIIGSHINEVKKMYEDAKTNIFFVEYSFRKHPDFHRVQRAVKYVLKPQGRLALERRDLFS